MSFNIDVSCFSKRFHELRLQHDYTQREFAKKLSSVLKKDKPFNPATIYYWETGKRIPSYRTLEAIAEIFNVAIEYLIGTADKTELDNSPSSEITPFSLLSLTQTQKIYFKTRLKKLRIDAGYSQQNLGTALAEILNKDEAFTNSAISFWEKGKRIPSYETIQAICQVFNCTTDYLFGLTNNSTGIAPATHCQASDLITVNTNELDNYHGFPLFITDKHGYTGWVLVNAEIKQCVTHGFEFNYKDIVKAKAFPSPHSIYENKEIKDFNEFIKKNMLWVEMLDSNERVAVMYNGWYTHNENHTALVKTNQSTLTLPYSGLNVTYSAW